MLSASLLETGVEGSDGRVDLDPALTGELLTDAEE